MYNTGSGRFFYILMLFLWIGFQRCSPVKKEAHADLLIINGKVWTGNTEEPWAEWIAITGDKITQVGSGVHAITADSTLDVKGKLVLPGFIDSHVHLGDAGKLLLGINLMDVNSNDGLVQKIKEVTSRLSAGAWITKGDWGAYKGMSINSEDQLASESWIPHKSLIDSLTKNHLVLVTKYDQKVGLANTRALNYLGIESETGILTGEVLENALNKIPLATFDEKLAEVRRALKEVKKWGVTSVQDLSAQNYIETYSYLRELNELTCRINYTPIRLDHYKEMKEKGWIVSKGHDGNFHPSGDKWLGYGAIKTHIDGMMENKTALFYEPYSDEEEYRGDWAEFSSDRENFKKMLLEADKMNIQLRIHAIGDQANSVFLDLLDTINQVNGKNEKRIRLVHAQIIDKKDLPRFKKSKPVVEIHPYHLIRDKSMVEGRIGLQRSKGAYNYKSLLKNGCVLTIGSDWPGTNASSYPINPYFGLYGAVTRQNTKGEPQKGWLPNQRLSLEEALRAYTRGSAYSNFEEDIKGTIEAEKLADIVVLDTDLFTTKPIEWLKGKVDYTIVGGKIVYSSN